MTDPQRRDAQLIDKATQATIHSIEKLLEDNSSPAVPKLTIAERDELIREVARIVPAGNVVNFILNGILSARERERALDESSLGRTHLSALFKGLSFMRNNLLYNVAFAGPATVLAGYNMLLQIAGAQPENFLPDGAWQFYVEFGLREDAAHHQNETTGFQNTVRALDATTTDQLCAWVAASMWLMQVYDELLGQVWEESVHIQAIETHTHLSNLRREWQRVRPFRAPSTDADFVAYRAQQFDQFCQAHLSRVSKSDWKQYSAIWFDPTDQEERGRRKRDYIRQMTLHRYLEPGEYSDQGQPIVPHKRRLAVVHGGNYYLLKPLNPSSTDGLKLLRQQVEMILQHRSPSTADIDKALATVPRDTQLRTRAALEPAIREELERLRTAPIILNWDEIKRQQPLTQIRNHRRGIGDHALTIFRTSGSNVFDFSHIFFDGAWAMAVAEILTNKAASLLEQVSALKPTKRDLPPSLPLQLKSSKVFEQAVRRAPRNAINTISGEAEAPLAPLQAARAALQMRTSIRLTINDLLVLYRTIFNQYYIPHSKLVAALNSIEDRSAAKQVEAMWSTNGRTNPSLLIPLDASHHDPKERVFPSTFRSPFPDFKAEHVAMIALLKQLQQQPNASRTHQAFRSGRENYLAYISAFSEVMRRYREIAVSGESMSHAAIRLIAGLPQALQQIADDIPGNFSVVNEVIKGEEVFSNVGQVVAGSTITRFASAKDDNDKKILVWGVMTDNSDQLRITLRDFRPAVLNLAEAGHPELAQQVTQDFLTAYLTGLYRFSKQMQAVVTV